MSDFAIHLTADMIGEADSPLSRMPQGVRKNARLSTGYGTGCAGASEARVLDNSDPLAKLAVK